MIINIDIVMEIFKLMIYFLFLLYEFLSLKYFIKYLMMYFDLYDIDYIIY